MGGKFYGRQPARRLLERSLQTGTVSHAYLLYGQEGLGKKTLARWFAQSLVCERGGVGCGQCVGCKKAQKGIHPDIVEVRPQGKQKNIPVDSIRSVIKEAYVLPNESSRRVFLIEQAQFLQLPAANALLKLLEEPPKHVVILLTCSSRTGVLPTISSRCLPLEVYPVSEQECRQALEEMLTQIDRETIYTACALSEGNIGLAAAYAGGEQGKQILHYSSEMEAALAKRKEFAFLCALAPLEENSELAEPVLRCFSSRLRIALRQRVCGQIVSPLAQGYSARALMKMAEAVQKTHLRLLSNANVRIALTRFSAELFGG